MTRIYIVTASRPILETLISSGQLSRLAPPLNRAEHSPLPVTVDTDTESGGQITNRQNFVALSSLVEGLK